VRQEVVDYIDDEQKASGEQEDAVSNRGEPMDGVEMTTPPSKLVTSKYDSATPYVMELQRDPKSCSSIESIENVNKEIKQLNQMEEQSDLDQWLIDYHKLAHYYSQWLALDSRVRRNGGDQGALLESESVKGRVQDFLQAHHYPASWGLQDSLVFRDTDISSSGKHTAGSDEANGLFKEPQSLLHHDEASPKVWVPGLTRKLEKILGMIPVTTKDIHGKAIIRSCSFLVEKLGQENPMVLEDAHTVGPEATKGYLDRLKPDEQNDVRSAARTYSPADREGFVRIKAVAWKHGYSEKVFWPSYVWAQYGENIPDKFLNRTSLRHIWPPHVADRMIEDFFLEKNLDVPWTKKAKRSNPGPSPASDIATSSASGTTHSPGNDSERDSRLDSIERNMAMLTELLAKLVSASPTTQAV